MKSVSRKFTLCIITLCLVVLIGMKLSALRPHYSYLGKFLQDQDRFVYHPPSQNSTTGQPLVISRSFLSQIGFPLAADFITLNTKTVKDFVFATAANDVYFMRAMDTIASIQKFFPNYKIIFYDLTEGLSDVEVVSKVSKLCNVQYMRFNFSAYPPHVTNLQFYAWKPIIIHDVLHHYAGVFWVDSSVHFWNGNITNVLGKVIDEQIGATSFGNTGHSIFAATHETMYSYLPISKELAYDQMLGATYLLLYRTKQLYTHVLRWWFLCALVKDCIAPTNDLICDFHGMYTYANCHRFDQSSFNVLMANFVQHGKEHYLCNNDIFDVDRGKKIEGHLLICDVSADVLRQQVTVSEYFPSSHRYLFRLVNVIYHIYAALFGG